MLRCDQQSVAYELSVGSVLWTVGGICSLLTTFFLTIVLLSVGMSTDIVPTDARPTDASSTHDPTKIEQSTGGEKKIAICELRRSSSIY